MPATRKLTAFMASNLEPRPKKAKMQAIDNGNDELRRAIDISRNEARLASMNEEEQLQEAMKQSMQAENGTSKADQKSLKRKSSDESSSIGPRNPSKAASSSIVPATAPILSEQSFDYHSEVKVQKLGASLDLIYIKHWLRKQQRTELREWMLTNLAWHRVTYIQPRYKIRIVTPRFTATFGKDETGAPDSAYIMKPKPFPPLLDQIRRIIEARSGARFNAIIINFYADGQDSISYHSDDEAFLGKNPTIASISLGASRDFYLRRKAPASKDVPEPTAAEKMGTKGKGATADRPMEKMVLEDGDLLLMQGRTQADWEHSIPKRARHVGGRINMTFRRVMNVSGTNNFIKYNRMGDGNGPEYRWDAASNQMIPMQGGI